MLDNKPDLDLSKLYYNPVTALLKPWAEKLQVMQQFESVAAGKVGSDPFSIR